MRQHECTINTRSDNAAPVIDVVQSLGPGEIWHASNSFKLTVDSETTWPVGLLFITNVHDAVGT